MTYLALLLVAATISIYHLHWSTLFTYTTGLCYTASDSLSRPSLPHLRVWNIQSPAILARTQISECPVIHALDYSLSRLSSSHESRSRSRHKLLGGAFLSGTCSRPRVCRRRRAVLLNLCLPECSRLLAMNTAFSTKHYTHGVRTTSCRFWYGYPCYRIDYPRSRLILHCF